MLYISAQPDNIYFTWQLEIQLRNFHSLGINKNDIHVLIAYNRKNGLSADFRNLIDVNKHLANFFIYPDLRIKPKYTSSVRPNILKQHFVEFPELELRTLFYHDSDVLFSRIPVIKELGKKGTCYVSDTRNYLDIDYIRSTSSEQLLEAMLLIVGLNKEKLEIEDENTGGAQYILTNINSTFWEKVERDCEDLFILMKDYNDKQWEKKYPVTKEFRSTSHGIQAWCSDMWALLWNLWLDDRKVEIHSEMTFSWPTNPIEDWNKFAIQHYSGNVEDRNQHFRKIEYINYQPWYDEAIDKIPNTTCSFEIVRLIKKRRDELNECRFFFNENIILLEIEDVNLESMKLFINHRNYIHKYFAITIKLLVNSLSEGLTLNSDILLKNSVSDLEANLRVFKSLIIIQLGHLINIDKLKDILSSHLHSELYFSRKQYQVDLLFNDAFSKMLDIALLEQNNGKFNIIDREKSIFKLSTSSFEDYLDGQMDRFTLVKKNLGMTYILS